MTSHPSQPPASARAGAPAPRDLLAAAIAGVLSYLLVLLPEDYRSYGVDWGAGVVFGALVLAPAVRSWWRRAGLVVASALVYRGAVGLAVLLAAGSSWPEVAACVAAGAVAAPVLALVALPLAGRRSSLGRHQLALAAGAVGGALIGIAVSGSDELVLRFDLPLAAGYLAWQVGWAAAHGPWRGGGAG
jgi:hypothetical protein